MDDYSNASFRATTLPFMLCPSDANAPTAFNEATATVGTSVLTASGQSGSWARGCYGANAIVNDLVLDGGLTAAQAGPNCSGWTTLLKRGVMLPNVACSMKQITDGTSKTVAVAEIRADIGPGAVRGVWALTSGASALFGFGCATQSYNPSDGTNPDGDTGPNNAYGDQTSTCVTTNGAQVRGRRRERSDRAGHGLRFECLRSQASRPKSMHSGGVQTVFCDGSVHWIDDSIQLGSGMTMGYWEMLFLSSDGGSLPQDVYNN